MALDADDKKFIADLIKSNSDELRKQFVTPDAVSKMVEQGVKTAVDGLKIDERIKAATKTEPEPDADDKAKGGKAKKDDPTAARMEALEGQLREQREANEAAQRAARQTKLETALTQAMAQAGIPAERHAHVPCPTRSASRPPTASPSPRIDEAGKLTWSDQKKGQVDELRAILRCPGHMCRSAPGNREAAGTRPRKAESANLPGFADCVEWYRSGHGPCMPQGIPWAHTPHGAERPMRATLLVLLASIPACVTEIGDSPPDCDVWVEETHPADGATDAFYRTDVEFRLSDPDPTAVVLSDVPGDQWTRDDGRVIGFTPWQPLAPDTAYDFGLDYCGGEPHVAFATDEVGLPLEVAPESLEGTAWWLDLTSGRYVRGEGLGLLVAAVFHEGLWIGVDDVSGGVMSLLVAPPVPSGTGQDLCLATVDLEKGSLVRAPWFTFDAVDVDAWLGTEPLPLNRVAVAGAFDPGATRVAGIAWRFAVDLRDLAVAVGAKDTEALCELATATGAPCEACDDGSPTCIVLEGDSFTATRVDDVVIERVDAPMTHPLCDR